MEPLKEGSFSWQGYLSMPPNMAWWKANHNVRDRKGWTAIHTAVLYRKQNLVAALVNMGADIYALTKSSSSNVLHLATELESVNLLSFFWEIGPCFDLQSRNSRGDTPLHIAARLWMLCGNRACFDFLMETGASNMNLKNHADEYVLDLLLIPHRHTNDFALLRPLVLQGARLTRLPISSNRVRHQLANLRLSLKLCRLASRATARALMHQRVLHKDVIPLIVAEIEKTNERPDIWFYSVPAAAFLAV